jgi:vestitone reductase
VATPVDLQDREPEEIVTKRAISGALGILQACLNSKTVKRVVYTSSASAVVFNGEEADEMDESFWSDVDFLKVKALKLFGSNSGSGSYTISKTLTERAVLEFGEKHGLDVVTIIPSFVVGPFICPKLPGSVRSTLAMVFGMCFNFSFQRSVLYILFVWFEFVANKFM